MSLINSPLSLEDLPLSPQGKVGWPWTEQNQPLPKRMPDGSEWPRISIVTPSYNQGEFIEETIRSVLLQGYPNLEYIIIDGGSTDNTVEIIKKYDPYLSYWVSEPDGGQSNALNKGFRRATGQLIGWQNSDDYYHPNAFMYAAHSAALRKDVDIIYGTVNCIDVNGNFIKAGSVSQFDLHEMLPWANMFNQSMFFRYKIFQKGNFINENFQHFMDYEFFWTLAFKGYKFYCVPEISAYFRFHLGTKGYKQIEVVSREYLEICKLVYTQVDLPLSLRMKALDCFRLYCLDYYGKLNLYSFRKSVQELIIFAGLRYITFKIFIRYVVSFLGKDCIKMLRNVKNFLLLKTPSVN